MLKRLLLLFFLVVPTIALFAQKASIKGIVADTLEKKKLQHSAILLIRNKDSILVKTVRTNANGEFEINKLKKGDYSLLVSYPKMADYVKEIKLTDSTQLDLGKIHMETKTFLLNEIIVKAQKQAISLKGDTIVYQADSFAVRPYANVEELLRRLPGMAVDKNGKITVAGKTINTVLVDGDEFFGDDPKMATKYLKANAVKEVEVYNKKSKLTDLTGIEDGEEEKVINIKLKEEAKNGYLSTLDANSDLNHFKDLGGMMGVYKGKTKMAIYGTTSNLNQGSKINMSMGRLKGDDYDEIEVIDDGSSISYMSTDDFDSETFWGSGLPNESAFGAYFSNKWNNNKQALKLNYKNTNNSFKDINTSKSQYLLPEGKSFFNSGNSTNNSKNTGDNLKGHVAIKLDSLSNLAISFGVNQSKNNNEAIDYSESLNDSGFFVSKNNQTLNSQGNRKLFNGNINYSRKFKTKGRTFSIDLQPEAGNNSSTGTNLNTTYYYDANGQLNNTDQLNLFNDNYGKQNTLASRISYTEPLSKNWLLQTMYTFKTISSISRKLVLDNNKNHQTIDSLSNNFEFDNFSNTGKAVLQYKTKKISLSGGLMAAQTSFQLNDIDRHTKFERSYLNWAPSGYLKYSPSNATSITVNYSGQTQQPGIEELQPIRQITNPLYQIVGNPNLRPSFQNSISLDMNNYGMKTDQFITINLNYYFTKDAITSTSNIDEFNKNISSYVNMDGNKSFSISGSYSKSFSKLKIRTGFNFSYNSSTNISILNNNINKNLGTRTSLRPNISYNGEKINISYSTSFNFTNNSSSIGSINNGKNYEHTHEINGTIQLPYQMEFNTSVSLSYRPKNASFNTPLNIALWNSYLSAKMLKAEELEIKLSVSDILNQKIGYNRYVGGNSIAENTYSYIPRYVLIGMTYNFSGNFKKVSN